MINVRDVGVTGDGTTDDTAAIQAAIDSVMIGPSDPALSPPRRAGESLYFPAGEYKITAPLRIWSCEGFVLRGEGATMTRFRVAGQIQCAFDLNGCYHASLSDFMIRSNDGGTVDTFDSGIVYRWDSATAYRSSSDCRFHNININSAKFKIGYQ